MLRKLAAALVFLAGLGVIALADLPFVRHASVGNSHVCSVQQFTTLPQHLDVVVLGSSRMRRGVDPAAIAAASGGRYSAVYNLARPGRNTLRDAAIVDELLASGHTIGVLVVEADMDTLRRGQRGAWSWRPGGAGFVTWGDILAHTPRTLNNGKQVDPRLVLDGLREKLEQGILLVTTGIAEAAFTQRTDAQIPVCWRDDFDTDRPGLGRLRLGALAHNRELYGDPLTAYDTTFKRIRGTRARVELQMLSRIRRDAEREHIEMIVVRPQGYMDPALAPEVVERLQRLVPEFRYPPEPLVRAMATTHMDANHFGPEGRAIFSRWIAETALAEPSRQSAP
jgi:hypothetical protein